MEHLYELHRVSEILLLSLYKDRGVIRKGLATGLVFCKDDSLDPTGVVDFYQEDFHHEDEDVRTDDVTLRDPLLELDVLSLVATQEDECFSFVKEEQDPSDDAFLKAISSQGSPDEPVVDAIKRLLEVYQEDES